MIIGNGDIAKVLTDKEELIYFASGVSDSQCIDEKEFARERILLHDQSTTMKRLVYFSSLSIYHKETPYTQHKRRMELLVRKNFNNYCIVRLGNITWGKNKKTIINYFKNQIKKKKPVNILKEIKYICTLE